AEPPGGVVAFFSCSEAERAFEHDDLKHGVFFHFVIEALKGGAATDGGEVTLASLSDYVGRRVADYVRAKYGQAQTTELIGKLRGVLPLVRLASALRQAQMHLARGRSWYYTKDYDKALADLNEAIRLDPKLAMAFNARGATWNARHEYDKALADLDEAIRLDPGCAWAFATRGSLWHAKQAYAKHRAE